jgi:hypothetical protein
MRKACSLPTLKEHVAAWPNSCLMLLDPRKVNLLITICRETTLICICFLFIYDSHEDGSDVSNGNMQFGN